MNNYIKILYEEIAFQVHTLRKKSYHTSIRKQSRP